MAKTKYYVVWKGRTTGIFTDWNMCKRSVEGYDGAQYKSFPTKSEAEKALKQGYTFTPKKSTSKQTIGKLPKPNYPALAVDAAWNTKTGDMEYQGVDLQSGEKIFHQGPFRDGTNNVGEFLAIVHALALLHKHKSELPIFSDSKTAMAWVRKKKANTTLAQTTHNEELFDMIERAEKWLKKYPYKNKIYKWETEWWGENPADFGRK